MNYSSLRSEIEDLQRRQKELLVLIRKSQIEFSENKANIKKKSKELDKLTPTFGEILKHESKRKK